MRSNNARVVSFTITIFDGLLLKRKSLHFFCYADANAGAIGRHFCILFYFSASFTVIFCSYKIISPLLTPSIGG